MQKPAHGEMNEIVDNRDGHVMGGKREAEKVKAPNGSKHQTGVHLRHFTSLGIIQGFQRHFSGREIDASNLVDDRICMGVFEHEVVGSSRHQIHEVILPRVFVRRVTLTRLSHE